FIESTQFAGLVANGSGWRLMTGPPNQGRGFYTSSTQTCTSAGYSGWPFGQVTTNSLFGVVEFNGTSHMIDNSGISTKKVDCQTSTGVPYGSSGDIVSNSGTVTDGSGYRINVTNY